jgi:ABC-type oligopeptide transport system substrate-binding subunit
MKQVSLSLAPLPSSDIYTYVTHNLDVASLPWLDRTYIHQPGVVDKKMLAIDGIYMNLKSKTFGDVRVRRALAMALDRTKLVSTAFGDAATPFAGFVPPGQDGYDPRLHAPVYSPSQARASLRAGGYATPNSFPQVTLYYAQDSSLAELAQPIASSWHKVLGIRVQTQALTSNTLVAKIQAGSLPLFLFGVTADYPDPHDWLALQWESGALYNNVNYRSGRFDKVAKTADVTWNARQRDRLDDQAQQILADDTASIPLYIPHRVVYIRPSVENLYVTGYGVIPRLGSWAQVQFQTVPASAHRVF